MKTTTLTTTAAVAAALFWSAKAVAIGGFGRDSYDDPVASALFVAGLISFVVAVVTLVWTTLRARHAAVRVLGAFGAVALGAAFAGATTPVFESAIDSWVGAELNLWIMAVALLAVVTLRAERRDAGGPAPQGD